jgi:hypothetical protein
MSAETVVTPFPTGSGRAEDWQYPLIAETITGGVPSLNWTSRFTPATSNQMANWALVNTGGVGSGQAFALRAGVPCVKMIASGGAVGLGAGFRGNGAFAPKPRLVKGQGILPAYDERAAIRVYANLAFNNIPAADCDYGMELLAAADDTVTGMYRDGLPGMAFVRLANGNAAFAVGHGAVTTFPVVRAGFDPTLFNSYEIRITSATKTGEASCVALVNGVTLTSLSWGAGTILPVLNPAYRQFVYQVVNYAGGSQELYVHRAAYQSSIGGAGAL